MPSEMKYFEHAKILYTLNWKTVAWEPKAYDALTFKMSENTPALALSPQRDPSEKKTSPSSATKSTYSVDRTYFDEKSTENFLTNKLGVPNLSIGNFKKFMKNSQKLKFPNSWNILKTPENSSLLAKNIHNWTFQDLPEPCRDELWPKSIRGNKFYKGHRGSHHFKKASIPLNMYLKRIAIIAKFSISLKKSSKIFEIFIKAPYFYSGASISFKNVFKKPRYVYKILILI
jgi:hypothetical protein